jgi:hypothetical protein
MISLEELTFCIVPNVSERRLSFGLKRCLELDLSKNKTNFLDSTLLYLRLRHDIDPEIVCLVDLVFSGHCMVRIVRLADLVHLDFCDDLCDFSGDDFRVWKLVEESFTAPRGEQHLYYFTQY